MRIMISVTIVFAILGLSGCGKRGWFRDRSEDYKKAESCKMLKVSPELKPEAFSEEYAIPGT